jgi:hypothetical protein
MCLMEDHHGFLDVKQMMIILEAKFILELLIKFSRA